MKHSARASSTGQGTPGRGKGLEPASSVQLAKETLEAICLDNSAPAAARAQAARTLLELAGVLKSGISGLSKTPAEMSPAELDSRLLELAQKAP